MILKVYGTYTRQLLLYLRTLQKIYTRKTRIYYNYILFGFNGLEPKNSGVIFVHSWPYAQELMFTNTSTFKVRLISNVKKDLRPKEYCDTKSFRED